MKNVTYKIVRHFVLLENLEMLKKPLININLRIFLNKSICSLNLSSFKHFKAQITSKLSQN